MPDAPAPVPASRRADFLIAAAVGIVLLGLLFYAASDWAMVLYRLLTDGFLAVLWLIAAFGLGRGVGLWLFVIPWQKPPTSAGPRLTILQIVTSIALGLGFLSILFLILGLFGWLNFWTVSCLLAIGVVLTLLPLALRKNQPETDNWQLAPLSTRWHWLWLAAMPVLSMVIVAALVPPGILWRGEPNGYDVVEYHLQVPREWYEAGQITPLKHNVFSYMPMNVEMHYLAAMHLRGGPWAGMYLAQFLHIAFIQLTVLAIYGFASSVGGVADPATPSTNPSTAAAILAAVTAALVPWMALLAPIAYNEGGLLLFGTLSIGWGAKIIGATARRHTDTPTVESTPTNVPHGVPVRECLLCGLFAGFACGTKLTAVPMILVAIPIAWIAIGGSWSLVHRRHAPTTGRALRTTILSILLFLLAAFLAFCPWLIRNQRWAGNPVFPELMPLLGQAHFTDAQVERYHAAHSPRPDQHSIGAHLSAGWNQIVADSSYGYILLPLGLLGGILALLRPRHRPEALFLLLLLLMLTIIWIGFTHLQGRFFILAIPILALLIAQINWGLLQWPLAAAVVAVGLFGFIGLNRQLIPWLAPQFLGMENFHGFLQELVPPQVIPKIDAGQSVALVGDARAFLYPIPMSRLHYRTVFDVSASPGQSLIDAWLGGAQADMIIVDPNELTRLTRTYHPLPPLPPFVADHDRPFAIPAPTTLQSRP
jgi:hypothetical protein